MGIAPTQAPSAPDSGQSEAAPAAPSPTATPVPAAMPETESSGKDSIIVVIPTEPDALSPWSTGSAETSSIVSYNWGEPLVWLDTTTLELGPTTSTTGWEQVAPTAGGQPAQGRQVRQRRALERGDRRVEYQP